MSIAAATELETAPSKPLLLPFIAAIGCAALADWLLYDWWVGISLALFYGVIGIVAVAVNGVRARRRVQLIMTAIFIAGLIALVEQVNTLSLGSPQVLPPIEARLSKIPEMRPGSFVPNSSALQIARFRNLAPPANWRAWSFRTWRLQRYFANLPPQRSTFPYPGEG